MRCMHTLTELGTVVALWAHPDDETYLSGGLLGALDDAGQRAVCITATRGEAADADAGPDERPRWRRCGPRSSRRHSA